MPKKMTIMVLTAMFVVMNALFMGALSSTVMGQSDRELSSIRVERIAVMPFFKGKYGGAINDNLDCKVCQFFYDQDALDPHADFILSRMTQETLEKRYGDKVVPYTNARDAFDKIPKDELNDTIQSLAQKLGPALNANLIIAGNAWKYRERVGGPGGVQSPASVGFAVYLIDPAGGKQLWNAVFAETQKTLFENVLNARAFFDTGAKWLTAKELAQYGISELFKKFPLQ